MKILRVIPSMNPKLGGPSQGIRNMIPELEKYGHTNEVICFDDSDAEYVLNQPFIVHALGKPSGPWVYNSKLRKWLDFYLCKYDVVIIHGLWLYHCFATYQAVTQYKQKNKKSNISLYVMPHGMLDPWFQNSNSRRFKSYRNYIYWFIFERHVVAAADGLLFTSELEVDLARKTFPLYRPKKELNVGYGIPEAPLFHLGMKHAFTSLIDTFKDEQYILYMSRINEKKGVDILIDAYIKLKIDGVNLPKLIIAGPGANSPYGIRLKNKASSETDILFLDMLSGDAKWGGLYSCCAFILPSHQENFGIAVVEALSCGKPVLISDQINIYTSIQGKGGLVDKDTYEGVRNLLSSWVKLSDFDKNELSVNAKNIYNTLFSAQAAAARFHELLLD
ncbi:glycosyltransferase [Fibrella forsythiae]|uniref:Glycosyltransferase n=1 Tax=Fibrella forsythiae TaxID=2817061 RepID=A0ABS3JCQ3_9BACT|nr:glycosyltransferase [Fibrella forsythiae]MBO0947781.1 glycosyltransferase [Fibrella forsythiae]